MRWPILCSFLTEVHAKSPVVAEGPTLLDDGAAQVMHAKQEELVALANEIISRHKSIFDAIRLAHWLGRCLIQLATKSP